MQTQRLGQHAQNQHKLKADKPPPLPDTQNKLDKGSHLQLIPAGKGKFNTVYISPIPRQATSPGGIGQQELNSHVLFVHFLLCLFGDLCIIYDS